MKKIMIITILLAPIVAFGTTAQSKSTKKAPSQKTQSGGYYNGEYHNQGKGEPKGIQTSKPKNPFKGFTKGIDKPPAKNPSQSADK